MTQTTAIKRQLYAPYLFMLVMYGIFLVFAFILDSPAEIAAGLWRIITSRSVLITDYIEVGGIGATLVNSAFVGGFAIFLMVRSGIKPNGAIIMALWLSTGFAFFGKNVFNMLPITCGVWLYSKLQREPFMNYSLASLLCATLSPVVSEMSFVDKFPQPLGFFLGVLLGIGIGFVFPPISTFTGNVHGGYCLYNMGFSGGLIATFVVCLMRSVGIEIQTANYWHKGSNVVLALLLYLISLLLILSGVLAGDRSKLLPNLRALTEHPGRLVSDFVLLFEHSTYVNMGLLCAFGTTLMLVLGGDLNGPTIGGIFTITGFGCFGKNLRNIIPIVVGAVLSTHYNVADPMSPVNTLAILFCTGLAPIAGQFGWLWGVVAGFLHVNVASFIGQLNGGLNLYNNGFAGGFVAMFLVPLIMAFRKERKKS